jgi:pimeloyl-ACP methyl ester carboxylesterase
MSSAYNHLQLAEALADSFTVCLPDRRGRGSSGPSGTGRRIEKEVEDLDALLSETGSHYVFGVSSGGIISLQAALDLPEIQKVAVYEPPLSLSRAEATAVLSRFDEQMAKGKVGSALLTGMKAAQMGPPIFNKMPSWLLAPLVNMAVRNEDKRGSGGYIPMRALAPTLHDDFQLVAEASGELERFRAITAETLLLGGSESPAYLKTALDLLERDLPHARRTELPGVGHAAAWNADRGGQSERVAQELRGFFRG